MIFANSSTQILSELFISKKEDLGRSFAKSKLLKRPNSLIVDKNDVIFVSDNYSQRVYEVSKDLKLVKIFAGSGEDTLKFGRGENANTPGFEFMRFDSKGNIIATSSFRSVIIKITTKGEVSLFAGSSQGIVDGPLQTAKFDLPMGILIDKQDNIYVSEGVFDNHGGNRIRKISNTGIVTSIAGGSGVGLVDGQGQNAKFNDPQKMVFDSDNNILIADAGNHAIRVLNSTGYVYTLAGGNGLGFLDGIFKYCRFNFPRSMVVDEEGDIYVGDMGNNAIRKLIRKTKTVVTVAGNGFAGYYDGLGKDSQFNSPSDLIFAPDRINILIADYDNSAIRSFNTKSTMVSTIVERESQGLQDGFGSNALLFDPKFLTVDKNNDIFVSDTANHVIRKVTQNGTVSTFSGFGGVSGFLDGRGSEALFYAPHGICYEPMTDSFFVMDRLNARVRKVFRNGSVTTVAGSGQKGKSDDYGEDATLESPYGCTIFDGYLYFTDWGNHLIRRIDLNTYYVESWVGMGYSVYQNGPRLSSGMNAPTGICSDSAGNLYFTDQYNEIRKVNVSGDVSTVAGNAYESGAFADGMGSNAKFRYPEGLACSNDGEIFVADKFNAIIRKVVISTTAVTTYAGKCMYWGTGKRTGKTLDARFSLPFGVAVATNGNLYLADSLNNAIKVVEKSSGRVKAVAGGGSPMYKPGTIEIDRLRNPQGIIAHPITMQIFIADTGNGLIHTWEAPQMKIYAGSGSDGWFDNPYDKRDSEFFNPHGIAFTRNGSGLLVADTNNHVIREITELGVRTIAGTGEYGNGFGAALSSKFNLPKYIVLDASGNIIVSDSGNHVIKRISKSNIVTTVVGAGTPGFKDGRSTEALLYHPIGLSFDSNNNLWIIDSYNHAIRLMNFTSNKVTTIAGTGDSGFDDGTQNVTFANPSGIAIDKARDRVYICDTGNNAVRLITKEGGIYKVATIVSENLQRPSDLALLSDNQLLILDSGQNAIKLLSFTEVKDDGINGEKFTIISVVLVVIFIVFFVFLRKRVLQKYSNSPSKKLNIRKNINTNVSKLVTISQKSLNRKDINDQNSKSQTQTFSLTTTISNTQAAIAIPGYLKIETLLDSIEMGAIIGEGGTSKIFFGKFKDPNLIAKHQVDVVVKILNPKVTKESFFYEILLMDNLPKNHQNVARFYGYSENPRSLIMQFYETSLLNMLNNCSTSAIDLKPLYLSICRDIASGMTSIHENGIIHFDLKPQNILVHIRPDSSCCFVISDFGYSKFKHDGKRQIVAGLSIPSATGLTIRYAAPELLYALMSDQFETSFLEFDYMVDVYSYAMIIYFVVMGCRPWNTIRNERGIESLVLMGVRPELSESVDPIFRELISDCWNHDPKKRMTFSQICNRLSSLEL